MTEESAYKHIARRMQELGYGINYHTEFKHLVLQANEQAELKAFNQLYVLIDDPDKVSISSEFGEYDLSFDKINELIHEHEGIITIHNYSSSINHVKFIQAIPTHFTH